MKAKSLFPLLRATALVFTATVLHAGAATSTWNADALGNWTDATKWSGGIPNGIGDTANLTFNITAARTITLNGDQTVGTLNIGDSITAGVAPAGFSAVTLNSGVAVSNNKSKLILDQTGVADVILTVPNVAGVAANSISALYAQLNDNLVITTDFPNSATVQLAISAIINDGPGSFSLTKNGPGIIQLSGTNCYDGGTTVNAGRINANNIAAFGTGPVTVGNGSQVVINTANSYSNYDIAGTGYVNTADTASQAGAIRLVNNRTLLGNVTVSTVARLGVDTTAAGYLSGNLLGTANLEINGPTTTTGSISLLGSAAGYTGTLSLARGSFNFAGAFGGSIAVAPGAGATTTLGAGTSIAGSLSLDSSLAVVTFRNPKGTLAISGNLNLTGATAVSPATFPTPGTATLTLMTYAAAPGTGSLTFDATNFRGSPTIAVGATAAVINGLDGKALTWDNTTSDGLWNVNDSANWTGGDTTFFHADAVTFGDAAPGTVTLVGTLKPESITFSGTGNNDYVISGSGTIDGVGGGIIKSGDAYVTLGGANTFTGPVTVNAGRLILGSATGLGFTSGVTVKDGAVFDINGQKPLGSNRLVDVTIAGTGDGALPALTNNGATIAFAGGPASGIRNVTLTADATVGCPASKVFDIAGLIDGGGHTLTKTGGGQVFLLGPSKNLNVIVAQGSLASFNSDPFGTNLRIESGATAQTGSSGIYTSNVTIASGGRLEFYVGVEALWTGTITAEGDVELSNGNTNNTSVTLVQGFAIPGNLTKSGNGTATLLGAVTVAGNVNVTGDLALGNGSTSGSLIVTGNGGSGSGNVAVNAGTTIGGPGTINGGVTVNSGANVTPGAPLGTLTVGATGKTNTLNGTLRIEYDDAATPTNDVLNVRGVLALGGSSVIDFSSVGAALTQPAYVVASYTSRTGTFGGITNVPAGYLFVYNYDTGSNINNIALIQATPYAQWIYNSFPREGNPAIVGPAADPDRDGLPNLIENYLGTNPAAFNAGLTQLSATGSAVTFRHSRADAPLPGYAASYEWSTNLTDWQASGATAGGVSVWIEAAVLTDNPSPENDVMQVVATVTTGTAPKLFVRLKATAP